MLLYWLDRKAFWTIGNSAYGLRTFSATCSMFVFTRPKTLDTCNEIKHKEWRRYFICCRHHTRPHSKNHSSLHRAPDTETHVTFSLLPAFGSLVSRFR